MHREAGSPSQYLVGLYTLKCGQEAREFDSLTMQRKYLCRASIFPKLWTVIVCQVFHVMDSLYAGATRQGWSPRDPWLKLFSLNQQNTEIIATAIQWCYLRVSAKGRNLSLLGSWLGCEELFKLLCCKIGKRWEELLESLTAVLRQIGKSFFAK